MAVKLLASIFANFNGWNFNQLNFLNIFAKPNGWKNPMVGMILIGWNYLLDIYALAKFEHS